MMFLSSASIDKKKYVQYQKPYRLNAKTLVFIQVPLTSRAKIKVLECQTLTAN